MYNGNHPNWMAKVLNRFWAWAHGIGIAPNYLVTLDVVGRKSGKIISFPLVMTVLDDQRYLVSMLGDDVQWVKNVQVANGKAVLRHGKRESVNLNMIPAQERPPILKAYLQHAPGAVPHVPVDKNAPLGEFERIAAQFPVFRVSVV
ncbi:MAG: DUF385 domain-containing protein [Anaerolineaceae bacterium]|nr:DUF385 domain-containing protein [Anaerolineaceae bacterium]